MPINKNEANKRPIEKINSVEEPYTKNFSSTQKILLHRWIYYRKPTFQKLLNTTEDILVKDYVINT